MFCQHCGKETSPDARFCPSCGKDLSTAAAGAIAAAPADLYAYTFAAMLYAGF
jgi:predicted amidophosphoribosyltransferase